MPGQSDMPGFRRPRLRAIRMNHKLKGRDMNFRTGSWRNNQRQGVGMPQPAIVRARVEEAARSKNKTQKMRKLGSRSRAQPEGPTLNSTVLGGGEEKTTLSLDPSINISRLQGPLRDVKESRRAAIGQSAFDVVEVYMRAGQGTQQAAHYC